MASLFFRPKFHLLWIFCLLIAARGQAQTDSIWDLEAVDADGVGTNPKVGAEVIESNKVAVEGIALNAPGELLNTAQMWQVYIQGESPDMGGIAAFSAVFYNGSNWPKYPEDIAPGDRVRVEGYVADHVGKVNINERHSPAPELEMTVTVLQAGAGMPEPQVITALADCNYFDQNRAGGGERYQGQWVQLQDVRIKSGTWAADSSLILTDDAGSTLTMLLAGPGDFGEHGAPAGWFGVRGIFDQEAPDDTDETVGYRLWVKSYSDFLMPAAVKGEDWLLYP